MTRQLAKERVESMGDILDWEEIASIYEEIIGEVPAEATEFELFSELCVELDVTE
jgi:hypothetical protein